MEVSAFLEGISGFENRRVRQGITHYLQSDRQVFGTETAGHILNVMAGSSLAVSFSLVGGEMTVEGFARRGGKAAPGAMVVLVPKDPDSHRDLFRRDQSDQDGSFSLRVAAYIRSQSAPSRLSDGV